MSEENKETKLKHRFSSREDYKIALDQSPNDAWVKSRNLGSGKSSKYIPIEIQQALADYLFDEIDVFDESYQQVENEILCTVKINYLPSYPNAEYRTMSGTGAKPIAAKSGSLPNKFPVGKITNSLEYCAPNARVSAISNALATCGNIFGRNLGRQVSMGFTLNKEKKSKKKKDGKG